MTLDVARLSAMAQEGQGLSRQTEGERESESEREEEEHEEQKGPAREGEREREEEKVEEEEEERWGGAVSVSARDRSGGGMSRSGGPGKEGCARSESETRRLVGEVSAVLVGELREAERELLSIRQGWAGVEEEEEGVKMQREMQRARGSQKEVEEVGEQVVKVALLLVP